MKTNKLFYKIFVLLFLFSSLGFSKELNIKAAGKGGVVNRLGSKNDKNKAGNLADVNQSKKEKNRKTVRAINYVNDKNEEEAVVPVAGTQSCPVGCTCSCPMVE